MKLSAHIDLVAAALERAVLTGEGPAVPVADQQAALLDLFGLLADFARGVETAQTMSEGAGRAYIAGVAVGVYNTLCRSLAEQSPAHAGVVSLQAERLKRIGVDLRSPTACEAPPWGAA